MYPCDECKFKSCTKLGLQLHKESTHPQKNGQENDVKIIDTNVDQAIKHLSKMSHLTIIPTNMTARPENENENATSTDVVIGGKYNCNKCNFQAKRQKSMVNHKKTQWYQKNTKPCHICDICDLKFCTPASLHFHQSKEKHLRSKYNKEIQLSCERCDFVTDLSFRMEDHKTSRGYQNGPISCNQCSFKSCTKFAWKKHYKEIHHIKDIKDSYLKSINLKCQKCDFIGNSLTHLYRHKRIFVLSQRKSALLCNKCIPQLNKNKNGRLVSKFCTKSALKKHVKSDHKKSKMPELKCDKCDYVTRNPNRLKSHQKYTFYKIGAKFYCDICNFGFCTKITLNSHAQAKHSTSKSVVKLQCDKCQTKFSDFIEMRKHITVGKANRKRFKNLGNGPFKCPKPNCPFMTCIPYHLENHRKEHSVIGKKKNNYRPLKNRTESCLKNTGYLWEMIF